MDKINVGLYGGKSFFSKKETPLRAEIIYCDKYDKCSLYKNNKCLNVTSLYGSYCKFGDIEKIQGYTSKAKKYYDFKRKYENDETHNKLKRPKTKFAIIDNYIYIDTTYVKLIKNEENKYCVKESFYHGICWIEKENFNIDLLYEIFTYKPQAMLGGEITSYMEEEVPKILSDIKRLIPNFYNDFINKYKEFNNKVDYIGREVYINSLRKGIELIHDGNVFIFDGEYLICNNWSGTFMPFNSKYGELKIKVTDNMIYKITDNSQVDDNTIFIE